ncbi:helix-hairpin-helix domain-containing protein [Halanaerobium kushneri]|uniref:Competence protein ComEA n=1 Tax=Halanaerobium kushneri TaxID=56779 RepID=A0A1N6V281_9FIRM|nr:helix-hairpin-helix domain-containing protein [Halanaerobium kushneri]SIQ71879.1 competence protein ComEA [Halanaerobium kushneri]
MFKNKVNFILVVFVLLIVFIYYNQDPESVLDSGSESNLNILETGKMQDNINNEELDKKIVVHLAGNVKKPGVYKLNKNDRLVDLIKAAGGLKEKADLAKINLAEKLYDGQKIFIEEKIKIKPSSTFADPENEVNEKSVINNFSANSSLININQADQNRLEKLSGIGPAKAAAIIKYREQNDYFSRKEDLLNVSGIGEKTLENIRDEIVLQ